MQDLLNEVNEKLDELNSIENLQDKQKYFENNYEVFFRFKNNMSTLLNFYLFKDINDLDQQEISKKLKEVLIKVLSINELFEIDTDEMSYFKYFKSEIFEVLSQCEGRYAYGLQKPDAVNETKSAIMHLKDREDFISLIKENGLLDGDDLNSGSAMSYINNNYEQNMFGHALMQVKTSFQNLSREEIEEILQQFDTTEFFENLIKDNNTKKNFYSQNLIYQYAETIIRMKSIFVPDKVSEDKMIMAFWNGEITDSKTVKSIVQNMSFANLKLLLEKSLKTSNFDFFESLCEHLKSVNMSDKNIAIIVKSVLSKDVPKYDIAKILASIDVPETMMDFLNGEHIVEYSWITQENVFDELKNSEKEIEAAIHPFLPCEYYIKKIDSGMTDEHFIQNLITLLHTDFYTQEEKENLIKCLKENYLYEEHSNDENAELSVEDKILQYYESGRVIPRKAAIAVINQTIKSSNCDEKVIEACLQSIIINYLSEKGIDLGNRVFFGNGEITSTNGYCDSNYSCIWINSNLVKQFINSPNLEDKARVFVTMFHEMCHTIQYRDIKNRKMDYLTYCFQKEELIESNDEKFYEDNYRTIYMEIDARRNGIIGALEFLEQINPDVAKTVKAKFEEDYRQETTSYTIQGSSKKHLDIGEKGTFIDVSSYVGYLIQSNPQILIENPILLVEYNTDGSQKDVETLIREAEQIKTKDEELYSVYQGLISKLNEKTDEKIEEDEIYSKRNTGIKEENDGDDGR